MSRILAWGVTLGLVALLGHLAHHITAGTAVGVLGFFGIEQADLYNGVTLLVVLPCVIAVVSFMLPGPLGPATRKALWWLMVAVFGVICRVIRGIGRAIWHLAEGSPNSEASGRKN